MRHHRRLHHRYGRAKSGPVNEHEATELELFADNESSIYNQKLSIIANIKRRIKKGTYDPALAPKLWLYWVDAAARQYSKEFPGVTFNKNTRMHVAEKIAVEQYGMIQRGEYD